jgi:hypothetical protein
MYDYVQMGFWTVLPYSTVRSFSPLRLAPSGVVPQRERRPHPIMDYLFYDVILIKLNLKVKITLDADNLLSLERHKAKGLKG